MCQPIRIQVSVRTTEILASFSLREINQFTLTRETWELSWVISFFPCQCELIDMISLRDNLTGFQQQTHKLGLWLVGKKNSTIMKCRLIYGALEKKRGPKMGFKLVWKEGNMSFVQAIRPANKYCNKCALNLHQMCHYVHYINWEKRLF